MGLNDTPQAERVHIALFGCTNAGKSSLLNAITGQDAAVVSPQRGTTTDPVRKAMELQPAGPVLLIDTPGLDDSGTLGELRLEKTAAVLRQTDVALLVSDSGTDPKAEEAQMLSRLQELNIPLLRVFTKSDLPQVQHLPDDAISVSASTGAGIEALKNAIAELVLQHSASQERKLVADLVPASSYVSLVIPIDKAAPKGRLILPQQQVIRDLLDNGCTPIVTRDSELARVLSDWNAGGSQFSLVITDSQAFAAVNSIVPAHIPLTSFSILMARYKGVLNAQLSNLKKLSQLQPDQRVLIAEGCTHHRQCGDIGTVKIPAALRKICGFAPAIDTCSGNSFPTDLSPYSFIVHCGGCTLTAKEMQNRQQAAKDAHIPLTNYGLVLALASGALNRSLEPLGLNL